MLDMVSAFAQLVTSRDYGTCQGIIVSNLLIVIVRPALSDTLAVKAARHPIKEKIQSTRYIPNDVYATQQTRFQIITGMFPKTFDHEITDHRTKDAT